MNRGVRHYKKEDLEIKSDQEGTEMWSVSLPNTMMTYFKIAAGMHFESQEHNRDQITHILEGCLYFNFEDGEIAVSAGEVIAIPAGTPHALTTRGSAVRGIDSWSGPLE